MSVIYEGSLVSLPEAEALLQARLTQTVIFTYGKKTKPLNINSNPYLRHYFSDEERLYELSFDGKFFYVKYLGLTRDSSQALAYSLTYN